MVVRHDQYVFGRSPVLDPQLTEPPAVMILGELCNFGAYAFVEAIVVVRTHQRCAITIDMELI